MPTRQLFALSLLGVYSALAQTDKAQLNGSVLDSSGAAVAAAQVTVTHTATGTRRSVETNDQGLFNLPFLDAGLYDISVQKTGFRTANRTAVKLDVAQIARIDFGLEVGAIFTAGAERDVR